MKKGARTRQRMLETTAALLQRQGYHGTGVSQVIKESGAPRGSLYFHFPEGKEQLACEAVKQSGDGMKQELQAVLDGVTDVRQALSLVCHVLGQQLRQSDYQLGCPVANLAMEMAAYSDGVQQACAGVYQQWEALISERLTQLGLSESRQRDVTHFVFAAIEGALLLSRTYRSTEPLEAVARELAALLPENSGGEE